MTNSIGKMPTQQSLGNAPRAGMGRATVGTKTAAAVREARSKNGSVQSKASILGT